MMKALLVLLLILGIGLQVGYAQSNAREDCGQNDDIYERITEDAQNGGQAGSALVLLYQSPSCRYQLRVYSIPGESELVRRIVVWDILTQQTIIDYVRPRGINRETIVWSCDPDETEVLIGGYYPSGSPAFSGPRGEYRLWNLLTGSSVVLHCPVEDGCIVPSYGIKFWDDGRNWLWVNSWEGVLVYDRATGEVVRSFPNPPWGGSIGYSSGHNYQFSSDATKLLVVFKAGSGLNDAITVWDINSMTSSPINVEGWVGRWLNIGPRTLMSECASAISLSPDNRYLAIGDVVIRVWDMQNLQPAYEDRLPLYRHEGPDARIDCLRFVDANTVETESRDGVQRWDVNSGALISQVDAS